MNKLVRAFYRCCRIPRSIGFGVQSPFAYDFVTKIVHDKAIYLAYGKLLGKYPTAKEVEVKLRQLLWRVCHWRQPSSVVVALDDAEAYAAYCQEAIPTAKVVVCCGVDACEDTATPDLLVISASVDACNQYDRFAAHATPSSVLFVLGIHATPTSLACWKRMVADDRSRVSFDFLEGGVIFFDKKYHKAHYNIHL